MAILPVLLLRAQHSMQSIHLNVRCCIPQCNALVPLFKCLNDIIIANSVESILQTMQHDTVIRSTLNMDLRQTT